MMRILKLLFVSIFLFQLLTSFTNKRLVYKGWTGFDKKTNTLVGFQPEGTIDIYSITLKGKAITELQKMADTISEKRQYYIIAKGKLIPDDDYKAPDGEFIVYKIQYLGDKN